MPTTTEDVVKLRRAQARPGPYELHLDTYISRDTDTIPIPTTYIDTQTDRYIHAHANARNGPSNKRYREMGG